MKLLSNSIGTRLILPLVLSALTFWGIVGFFYYRLAVSTSFASHDLILTSLVNSLAQRVHSVEGKIIVDFPTEIIPILREKHLDDRYFTILDDTGKVVAGNANIAIPVELPEKTEIIDVEFKGSPLRLAVRRVILPESYTYCDIAIGETLLGRYSVAKNGLEQIILCGISILIFAILVKLWVVRRGLQPLSDICERVSRISPGEYKNTSLSVVDAPTEVQPLVQAINGLLERVSADLDNQKRFIGNAAHQLRTPLAGIKIQAELLAREKDKDRLGGMVGQLEKSIDRTCNLVNKMLSLEAARPESHDSGDDSCNLAALAKEVLVHLAPISVRNNIDLSFDENEESAQIEGSSWKIQELINNLVENAVLYSRSNGQVTVKIETSPEAVILNVEDEGPGIPECERERIFERFYRLSDSPGVGTGLGLAIVKEIADQHAAKITISSKVEGVGSRIRVVFPKRQSVKSSVQTTPWVDTRQH